MEDMLARMAPINETLVMKRELDVAANKLSLVRCGEFQVKFT